VKAVVITLGKDGAVGVDVTGHSFGWIAPNIPSVSAVGSGDSFLAGIIVGLVKGQSLENAVRLGIATGAANTLQIGAAKFELSQVEAMLNIVQPLSV
jgi:fructose-1-phosphate kinase PfkB-like protein